MERRKTFTLGDRESVSKIGGKLSGVSLQIEHTEKTLHIVHRLQIFSRLRYMIESSERAVIVPPDLDGTTPSSLANRAWLLRSWLEISCFIAYLKLHFGENFNRYNFYSEL
jgi:hypothetical protein